MFYHYLRTIAAAALMMLTLSTQSHAGALGDATLHSKLGEPINITIEILGTQDLLADEIQVKLNAVKDDLASVAALRNASIEILARPSGKLALIQGASPMREPYLHFHVQLQQTQGNISRDYVLVFDL